MSSTLLSVLSAATLVTTVALGVAVAVEAYPDREGPRALFYLYMLLSTVDLVADAMDIRRKRIFSIYESLAAHSFLQTLYGMFIVLSTLARLAAFTQLEGPPVQMAFYAFVLARCGALIAFMFAIGCAGSVQVCFRISDQYCCKCEEVVSALDSFA